MNFESNWGLIVIALIALISPVVTTLINNHHLKKMRMIELSQKRNEELSLHSREIFEQYLKSAGDAVMRRKYGGGFSEQYHESYYRAFFNASPHVRELMERADFFIEQKDSHAASVELCKIAALAQKDFLHSYEQFK